MSPKLSVLTTVWNGGEFLRPAVESILAQSFKDFEYVIVNDGSTDGSREIVKSFSDPRIAFIDNKQNAGRVKALNQGLAAAKGELVALIDADDISFPRRLELQTRRFEAEPELALLGTMHTVIDGEGRQSLWRRRGFFELPRTQAGMLFCALFEIPVMNTSIMFRRDIVLNELGGYREDFASIEDYEMVSRLLEGHRASNLPEPLCAYRVLNSGLSRSASLAKRRKKNEIRRRNLESYLKLKDPELAFAETWTNLANAMEVHPEANMKDVPNRLKRIYGRFIELHPEAASEPEMRYLYRFFLAFAMGQLCYFSKAEALKAALALAKESPLDLLCALPRLAYKTAMSLRQANGKA